MLDATAKPMSGFFAGNLQQIGNYDQCLDIKRKINDDQTIKGKYCTAGVYQANTSTPLSVASVKFTVTHFSKNINCFLLVFRIQQK